MKSKSGYSDLYEILLDRWRSRETISVDEIAAATRLKASTIRVYIRNKLSGKYLSRTTGNSYKVTDLIETIDQPAFVAEMSQKTVVGEPKDETWKHLVRNANQCLLAAIEIHNKPLFPYRYEVVSILLVNAWELLLKAHILRYSPKVKLVREDGTTKPFPECLAHVSSQLGNQMPELKDNIEVLYQYRNEYIHYYAKGIDVLLFGVVHKSVQLYHLFVSEFFGRSALPRGDFVILPIGFRKPVSPIDFLTNESALSESPPAVKTLIADIIARTDRLLSEGVEETIFVPYAVATINENRVKNADIVAAISSDQNVSITVKHEMHFTDNPSAKEVRIAEDSLYHDVFRHRYADVVSHCMEVIPGFKKNRRFNEVMKRLKEDPSLHRARLLDPDKPTGVKKDFYSDQMLDAIQKEYSDR